MSLLLQRMNTRSQGFHLRACEDQVGLLTNPINQ